MGMVRSAFIPVLKRLERPFWITAFFLFVASFCIIVWQSERFRGISASPGYTRLPAFSPPPNAEPALARADLTECVTHIFEICFVKAPEQLQTAVFGFAEFMTALALLIVLYTISDVRYRFRVSVAPIPLFGLTYILLGVIGLGSLLADVWFAMQWPIPDFLGRQALWQAAFGAIFLLIILVWIFYAFIKPPVFGRSNYEKLTRNYP